MTTISDSAPPTTQGAVPSWTLGDRLKKARLHANLEQRDMAAALGVTGGAISNWEKGSSRPRQDLLEVVQRWSDVTGVSYEWLLGVGARKPVSPRSPRSASHHVSQAAA